MTLIAQTFAPFSSKTKRYDQAGATYSVINQIGAPAVKRVVSDNNSRIYPITDRIYDVETWEPYFYSTQLGLDIRKITFSDPSLRILPFEHDSFDDVNEPYAITNQIGVPAIKRVVTDNSSRIIPIKVNSSYRISYVLYNYFYEIIKSGLSTIPTPAGTTGINGTSQRAVKFKNIPYSTISYLSYNLYSELVQTGTYTKPTQPGTIGISGTTLAPTNVNDSTNYSISDGPYPNIVQEGITLYKVTISSDIAALSPLNVNDATNYSIDNNSYYTVYQVGTPIVKATLTFDYMPLNSSKAKFYNRTIEGPYYNMTKVGLASGVITTNYQFWS